MKDRFGLWHAPAGPESPAAPSPPHAAGSVLGVGEESTASRPAAVGPVAGLDHDQNTGQWFVRTQALADVVLRDPHTGMSPAPTRVAGEPPDAATVPSVTQFFDLWYRRGANHPMFGKELRRAYGASAVDRFTSEFTALATQQLADLPERGDLVAEFVAPYCLHSTFRLMGFARAEWPNLTKAYHVLMYVIRARTRGGAEPTGRAAAAFTTAVRYLGDAIDELMASTAGTPLVAACQAYARTAGRDRWADVATVGQLLAAGVPQVTTGLAVACRSLCANPGLLAAVRAGDVTAGGVAEESMRLHPPFLAMYCWVRDECDCLGVRLAPRTPLVIDIVAANTDPARTDRPTEFCPTRNLGTNLTFGKGAHYCPGATSARTMIGAALHAVAVADRPPVVDVETTRIGDDGFARTVMAMPYVLVNSAR
jgi:cytochrome P450